MVKPVKKSSAVMRRIEEALKDHFDIESPSGPTVFTLNYMIKRKDLTIDDFQDFSQEDLEEVLHVIKDALNSREGNHDRS
ncbi:MAG: hypothetical protein GY797_38520 [Deltaproteobacteria bacterium]|nr:hypothetical protein [Deltaproteobacteria bacterium]